jgi:hypothetical protein
VVLLLLLLMMICTNMAVVQILGLGVALVPPTQDTEVVCVCVCVCVVTFLRFYFCVSVHRSISQIKHQLDATLCRFISAESFYMFRASSAHHQEY